MLVKKKNFENFYSEIRSEFPKIRALSTWDENDWSIDGSDNSIIMSEICVEMSLWASKGYLIDTRKLMDFIEEYFSIGDMLVTSIIYTSFQVTIMEIKNKENRDTIKQMMGSKSSKNYIHLLDYYREAN